LGKQASPHPASDECGFMFAITLLSDYEGLDFTRIVKCLEDIQIQLRYMAAYKQIQPR
jgi:hypothetical protein